MNDQSAYVYLLASRKNGALYLGATSDLAKRVAEHRSGVGSAHTAKYKIFLLVWFAQFSDILQAREQELRMKKWPREFKENLINEMNPEWLDLALQFNS